jgi:hypothetical protein
MTRIASGGKSPVDSPETTRSADQTGKTPTADGGVKDAQENKVVDSFQRMAPQLTQRLEAMAGKKAMPGVIFTSEHLGQVAMAFAQMLRKAPGADRRERARMFAQTILKRRKFAKIFDEADERDLEKNFDLLGKQLDGSPVLAQLVDDVTEGARKINLG